MAKKAMTAALRVRMTSEELVLLRRVAEEEASSMGRIVRLAMGDYLARRQDALGSASRGVA